MDRTRVSYSAMKKYLSKQGLTSWEALQSVKKLRTIDRDLRRAFVRCFNEGIEPDIRIAGLSYQELTTVLGMNVIEAFLYLDWLRKEPELALDTLDRTTPMEIDGRFLEQISETFSGRYEENGNEEEADTSDLAIE